MSNKSFENYGVKTLGGKIGGNFDRLMQKMITKHDINLQKHDTFVPKNTDSSFLNQTDKFWNPADLPF